MGPQEGDSPVNALQMGIPGGGIVHPGIHACALFSGPVERDRLLVSFMKEGLRHGDQCVCLIDELETASMRQRVYGQEELGDECRHLDVYAAPDAYLRADKISPQQLISSLVASPGASPEDTLPVLVDVSARIESEAWDQMAPVKNIQAWLHCVCIDRPPF